MADILNAVRVMAMNSAAGIPLSETSPMIKQIRSLSRGKKSYRSPPTSYVGMMVAKMSTSLNSGSAGKSCGTRPICIQMGLVPHDFPALPEFKEVDIFATIIPTYDVGGDLYDFFPLDKDRICFIIGDVSDKGIPAALFMAMTRTAFKMSAIASPDAIGPTMARVNQFLCESNPQQMFVTALAGILDLRTGQV